jgi:hypothetical protein
MVAVEAANVQDMNQPRVLRGLLDTPSSKNWLDL